MQTNRFPWSRFFSWAFFLFLACHLDRVFDSLTIGDGQFHPVPLGLVELCGNEMNAVLLQTACFLLVAMIVAWATVTFFDREGWSPLGAMTAHFLVGVVLLSPISYLMEWIPHHSKGILSYFGIFLGLYFICWSLGQSTGKKEMKAWNEKLNE